MSMKIVFWRHIREGPLKLISEKVYYGNGQLLNVDPFSFLTRFSSSFVLYRTLRLSESRPVWNRLGSFRSCRSLLVRVPFLLSGPKTVRETIGWHAADPDEIRGHGHRNIHRPAGVPAGGPVKGTGVGHTGNDFVDQTELNGEGVGDRQEGSGYTRGERDKRRVPHYQTPDKLGDGEHVRRNVRYSRVGVGKSDHRDPSVPIVIQDFTNCDPIVSHDELRYII